MLESLVKSDNFQKGVTNYLEKHKNGNAISQDLWDEVQNVVGDEVNITELMDTFTVQKGYPILEAKVDGNKYTLTQKRFSLEYHSIVAEKKSPLKYQGGQNSNSKISTTVF
jgi:aminopeptidase N